MNSVTLLIYVQTPSVAVNSSINQLNATMAELIKAVKSLTDEMHATAAQASSRTRTSSRNAFGWDAASQ